jgi:hypothetical protein
MRSKALLAGAGASSIAAGALYAWPTYGEPSKQHREFTEADLDAIRDMGGRQVGSACSSRQLPGPSS